jgi:hypothetical protein
MAGGRGCGGGLRGGSGLADVTHIGFGGGVFEREFQVVDEEADVAVGERNLKMLEQFFLDGGEVVAGGYPSGDCGFLLGGEGHGRRRSES